MPDFFCEGVRVSETEKFLILFALLPIELGGMLDVILYWMRIVNDKVWIRIGYEGRSGCWKVFKVPERKYGFIVTKGPNFFEQELDPYTGRGTTSYVNGYIVK